MSTAPLIIITGPPGSGKGTLCGILAREFGFAHFSTGEILRDEIAAGTEAGKLARELNMEGKLFPDQAMLELLSKRMHDLDNETPVILDGFPRNIAQAKELDNYAEKLGRNIEHVISLHISDDLATRRSTGRVICKSCGSPFHLEFSPPKTAGICDFCGGELYQREDDNAATMIKRLERFHTLTEPMFAYYKDKNIYHEFDGERSSDELIQDVLDLLDEVPPLFEIDYTDIKPIL